MSVLTKSWPLLGGLDLVSPSISIDAGRAILAQNYEPAIPFGYSRIEGYLLFDGSLDPSEVSGSGPIRGVWELDKTLYAFRDNVAGSACVMYRATVNGWSVVTTPNLVPGGSYDFVAHNFGGHTSTEYLYGCDGKNPAFQFDGTTFTQIPTGMTDDTPHTVGVHKNHLFLAFAGGSVQHSGIAEPTTWTLATGAGELGIGAEVTGLHSMQGNALIISHTKGFAVLYGTSSSDWDLQFLSTGLGPLPFTQGYIESDLYFFNGDYITSLAATQAFGNFAQANLSSSIIPLLKSRNMSVVGASINPKKSQFRLFFKDKTVVVGVFLNRQLVGYTTWKLDHEPSSLCEGYMGCADGSVMKLDTGNSFNGNSILSLLRLPFTSLGTPYRSKRFRKLVVDMQTASNAKINYIADLDYGASGTSLSHEFEVSGGGGLWDVSTWNNFIWDANFVTQMEAYINSSGKNISLLVAHDSATDKPFTLQAVQLNYSMRGIDR